MTLTVLVLGLFSFLSFLVGTFLIWRQARQLGLSEEKIIDLCLACVFLGLFGGRLAYALENWNQFQVNFIRVLLFLKYPGFSLLGAALFFLFGLVLIAKFTKLKISEVLDIFSVPLVVAAGLNILPCTVVTCSVLIGSRIVAWLLLAVVLIYWLQKIKDNLYNDSRFGRVKHKQGLVFSLTVTILLASGLVLAKNLPLSLYFGQRILVLVLLGFTVFRYRELIFMIKLPQSVLGQIRKYLEDKLRDTEHRLSQLRHEDPTSDKDRLHQESSDDDTATDKAKHERVEALQAQLNRSVIEIRKALTKIKVGSYGNCENCGKLIDTDRLAAMPQATLCMDCEKKREKGKK